jgi:ribosomal protein S20
MPHHKSAEKRLVTNEISRQRNNANKSLLRKRLKEQRTAQGAAARELLPETYAEVDRAWRKGILPRRRADRLKSRLARAAARTASS